MNQPTDTKRLAEATTALVSTIMEIIKERLQAATAATVVQEQQIAPKVQDPWLTRQQAAEYFQVSLRTMANWLEKGYLPHYRIKRTVRIRMSDVEACWKARYLVRRGSWSH